MIVIKEMSTGKRLDEACNHNNDGKRSTAPPCQAPSYAMAGALIGSNSSIRL